MKNPGFVYFGYIEDGQNPTLYNALILAIIKVSSAAARAHRSRVLLEIWVLPSESDTIHGD
ncbi:hypothetical protein C7B82_08695 [Stenomitos frigidus ULC18]|uniref:Uncharacterized protein n=1 Tax=Stenomitos frigidus ULC18 TaxID=2107698 RepID=A0A2T1ECN6_9CYAN|nr:hypothetical protein C7B82_08695 [Stenomitos frigidus ULC18]